MVRLADGARSALQAFVPSGQNAIKFTSAVKVCLNTGINNHSICSLYVCFPGEKLRSPREIARGGVSNTTQHPVRALSLEALRTHQSDELKKDICKSLLPTNIL